MHVFVKTADSITCSKNIANVTCPYSVPGGHHRSPHLFLFSRTVFCPTSTQNFFFFLLCFPTRAMASSFFTFLDHKERRAKVVRPPLDEWSARRRDLYLTTHNTQDRHPGTIKTDTLSRGPQGYAQDRTGTETGRHRIGSEINETCGKWNDSFYTKRPLSLHLHRTTKQRSGRTHSRLKWTSKRQSSGRGPH
jgi:hypothetical protein